jgi:putative endopeptidase
MLHMRLVNLSLAAALSLSPSLCLAAGGGGNTGAGAAKPGAAKGFDTTNLDTSVKPCEDFNRYANGGWVAKNPIPAEYPRWGTFQGLRDRNLAALHQILEDASKEAPGRTPAEQKIGDFYASALDTKTRDAAGIKPLQPLFDRLAAVKDQKGLQEAFAYLASLNVDAPFGIGAIPDFKNSKQMVAYVGQGGLGLPDRDYYTKQDEKSQKLREAYVAHVAKMFELTGDDAAKAAASAKTVLEIETRLANASLTNVDLRDPSLSYHMMDAAARKEVTPNFAWERYFEVIGRPDITTINVAHPKFFKEVDAMLTSVPVDAWKTYLRWHVVHTLADSLSTPLSDQNFAFYGKTLQGTPEQSPLWKRAVRSTDSYLGDALGQAYVKTYFPPESKQRMRELVKNLKAALREDIQTIDWMSDATRTQALAKLDAFVDKIGYPDKWRDYSTLQVERGQFAANVLRGRQFQFREQMAKVDKPVDRAEWGYSAPTVNASYNPLNNDITFPAGILQPPFFNPDADDAINYGAIGAVIGHEMTHGFDDEGAQYDADGNLKNWWTDKDLESFKARAKCVEDQFGAYTVEGDLHLNGKLVTGESIADLGGLTIAYAAFKKSLEGKPHPAAIDGFTPEQRFFLGWAQVWAENQRPEFTRLLVDTDPHPIARFRVNGPLSNMPAFAEAFGCKQGDAMVRPEAARCQIW